MDPGAAAALENGLAALGIGDRQAAARLAAYVELLERWNRRFNLTGSRAALEIVARHVLDCAAVTAHIDADPVLDLGSGAGLPGLVLAVLNPARRFVLLDSVGKKVRFLEHARDVLGIENVEVVQARAEAHRPPAPYPTIISRACGDLAVLVRLVRPLLAPDGALLAMKGRLRPEELGALAGLRWEARRLAVPGLAAERHLVVVRGLAANRPGGGAVQ